MTTILGSESSSAHLIGSMNWEPVRKRLLLSDLEDALAAVTELREKIEIVHSSEFPLMLSALLPALSSILTNRTKPSDDVTSLEHRLRNAVLDFMAKFPANDTLRPHAPHLVAVALDILTRDYESNALLASRIIFDLYKVYRNLPQDHVQPFLDFVLGTLRNMPAAVNRNFSYTALTSTLPVSTTPTKPTTEDTLTQTDDKVHEESDRKPKVVTKSPEMGTKQTPEAQSRTNTSVASSDSSSAPPNRVALRSNASFRVLTECPLIMMLMFQLFPKFLKTNIPSLIAVMTEVLGQRPPPFASFPPSAKNDIQLKRLYYTRVRELVAAQTKTLSFLTYLLRGFTNELRPYGDRLAGNVVALMSTCPKESVSTRKELLVATRHLLGSEFRSGFFRHVDVLLDEKVLMGSHHRYADHNLLRPLGYTTLSELVQHVRTKLTMGQVSRVVSIFSRVLHDSTVRVSLGTQYAAVRTLLSLIDMVYHNKDPNVQLGRDILIRILSTLVDKLKSLVIAFPQIKQAEEKREASRGSVWEKRPDPLAPGDTVRDIQSMVRAIVAGCKSLIYYASNYRNNRDKETAPLPQPGMNDEVSNAMLKLTNGEVLIVQDYILAAIPAMTLLKEMGPCAPNLPGDKTHLEHYRDALTYFAASFTGIDGFTLRRTLGRKLDFIVDTIIQDPVAMVIPRHLLASNGTTSFEVCGMLLNHLIDRMDDLALPRSDGIVFLEPPGPEDDDETSSMDKRYMKKTCAPVRSDEMVRQTSTTLLHLFERILKSLAVYPENESLVRRHLRRIVVICLRSSMENTNEWPDSYCMLLRYVFRSISAGKFEESYKELLPLIPTVLNGLYKTICASVELPVRHTAIELCLTIPARLSSLLPHMNLLLRIIVMALVSDIGDLVNLGLRTLEFWVDNLNPRFLYPEISKQVHVFTSLMQSLSRHLRPAPYPYGLLTLRLLGKLGGKNRQFLREPLQLPSNSLDTAGDVVSFQCKWTDSRADTRAALTGQDHFSLSVSISRCVELLRNLAIASTRILETSENIGESGIDREVILWEDADRLWDCEMERIDYDAYLVNIMENTKSYQAVACVQVIIAAISSLEISAEKPFALKSLALHEKRLQELKKEDFESKIKSSILGLLYGTMVQASAEMAWDALGSSLSTVQPSLAASAISDFFSVPSDKSTEAGLAIVEKIIKDGKYFQGVRREEFLESLVARLCDLSSVGVWKERIGPQKALLFVLGCLERDWSKKHEFRLVTTGFLAVKCVPRELSMAAAESIRFFVKLCVLVYGAPLLSQTIDEFHLDPMLLYPYKGEERNKREFRLEGVAVNDEVVKLVVQELGSQQQTTRVAARIFLSNIITPTLSMEEIGTKYASTLRKLVFSRSLRILPLPQQVGAIEALVVIINEFPDLISIKDQHFLSFLSELLKMCSVADGEMQDSNSLEAPNKNGHVCRFESGERNSDFPTHCSALFFRREAVVDISGTRFVVPEELPVAVQLRTSAITLLHSVVSFNSDPFFDAESTTAVGNIRPHIVSLLFRSLASTPRPSVVAAHKALREVLSLSLKAPTEEGGKNQSRLPKELLQRCIRPVLLNLRDFTMLSVPLLRGLSRLLALLNSWFNKTLGEKLLDHLQKWTDPPRIMSLAWGPGEETRVAASMVGIFCLLPHASQFVEHLVKTCIKIEAALPVFKNFEIYSPFRRPLARFLDKYPQETTGFFFPRLKTPIYSEIFQEIVKLDESRNLRAFLGNRSSSLMILNRCFERPLAIMRAERGSSPGGSVRHSLSVHGIGDVTADQRGTEKAKPMGTESLELQFQGFNLISTLHEHDPDYLRNHNDIVRALRWLWRSKGRYLRLQHESQIAPRFHSESTMLATFLMSYAEQFPNEDVGVLFELILVFLHTSTVDFDFVANFLKYMVRDVLDLAQKQQALRRFFEMVGGDSNEETKVLTVQFVIFPLLEANLAARVPEQMGNTLVDENVIKTFVETALIQNGRPVSCGDRLRVELLKLTDLFVSKVPNYVKPFQKEVVKICWSLLKMEDSVCKSWAYVVACRLVATFDTAPKVFLQVFSALLRSHHQEDKELVRNALDLLIPAMPKRLGEDEKKAIDQVSQMMLEEASSTPQLAHLCQTILRDGEIFRPYRECFVGLLANSVARLAIPPSSPFENRLLAVEVVALLLHWSEDNPAEKKLLNEENLNSIANSLVRLKMLLTEPADGRSTKVEHAQTSLERLTMKLLQRLLVFPDVCIRSQPFEKIGSCEKSKPTDSPGLISSLELFTCIASCGVKDFFEENDQLVITIVEKSFELSSTDVSVRSKLNDFIFVGGQIEPLDGLIAVSLEKVLLDASRDQKKQPSAASRLPDPSPRPGVARGRDKGSTDESMPSLSFLVDILRALARLCSKRGVFRARIAYSLLTIGSSISKHHVAEAAAKQRQGSSYPPRSALSGVMYHTPTIGILEAALEAESTDFARLQSSRHRAAKESTGGTGTGEYVECLLLILMTIDRSELPMTFTTERKMFVQLIGGLLDGSDSVHLLSLSTKIIGKWLLPGPNLSPLTVKEKHSFLWRLSSFDSKLVSDDLASQPLADLVASLIRKLPPSFGTGDLVYGRSLVACLLNSNVSSRQHLLNIYLRASSHTETETGLSVDSDLSHFDVLWRVLHSDFEGLGGRHWVVVFAEALLSCVHATQPSLLSGLRVLVHSDVVLCRGVLSALLSSCWTSCPNDEDRILISTAIESLLSRPYHTQFLQSSSFQANDPSTTNPVKDLLAVVPKMEPVPFLEPKLLVYLAENYNAWHEVIHHLEKQYVALKSEPIAPEVLAALRHCYKKLGEYNLWTNLAAESCELVATECALALDVYGLLKEASDAYGDMVSKVESQSTDFEPSDYEMDLWEERWIEIHRELCELSAVTEFANTSANHRLQLECAWKTQEWGKVRALCASTPLLSAVESGDAVVKMSETLLAVADGKLADVENLHAQTAQLCLYKWQLLPCVGSGSPSHASLLHFFHRLVEVRESGQLMVETASHANARTLPDLKNLLSAWRHRLPNDWEPVTQWDEIFAWRSQMFRTITKNFQWADPSMLSTIHDAPWSSVRMAKTVRKQGLLDVSALLLSQAEEREVNVADAYLKLREQILTYYNEKSELERHGGLNLVNTTNFDFFDVAQKSELFRLKATFLASLGGRSKANQAYCHSLLVSPENARAWVSWGELCASLGAVTEEQVEKAQASGSEQDRESVALSMKKVPQYLTQAMGCFLEAIRIDAHEWSRLYLPKCLWMLTKDSSPAVICPRFESRGLSLPPWVWLPWLPQLLTGFYRPEGRSIKRIFSNIVRAYPQAAYYTLRSFYLERRDVERAVGSSPSISQMPSVAYAEEMMSLLRRSHPCLWSSLEAILEELIVKFRPSTEEEFLATIVALLERAESQTTLKSEEQNLASSIQKTLSKIAYKYFRPSESSPKTDERAKRTAEFKSMHRETFESDFHVDSSDSNDSGPKKSMSLDEILTGIRNWRDKLQEQVLIMQPRVDLVEASPSLAVFGIGDAPDLWPGSCDPREASPPLNFPEHGFQGDATGPVSSASSASAARKAANGASNAASSLASKEGVGGDYGGGSSCIEIPGQYMPNSSSWTDTRPSPELHVKLIRFQPKVEVVRRSDQLVRRIGVVGSDGKQYKFLLQCALSYWTRTDERSAQIHFVVEKLLRRSTQSARAQLSVQPHCVIPIAQRLRLVQEEDSRTSLQEEYDLYCTRNGKKPESAVFNFNEPIRQALSADVMSRLEGEEHEIAVKAARLGVYEKVCVEELPNRHMLAKHVSSRLEGAEALFSFRRMFTQQWAIDCLLQHVFAVSERTPGRVVFVTNTGRILSPDARLTYNNQGFLERRAVPFRMSPNIAYLIGFPLLRGHFIPSMSKTALAVHESRDIFDPILKLLLRDDLTSFYTKSIAKSDTKTQEMERQLLDRITKNTLTVKSRFAECSPLLKDSEKAKQRPVDHRVRELLEAAQDPNLLCMMQGSYQAWL